jgi:RNA polymerase sigma factor (sigma-70 family)
MRRLSTHAGWKDIDTLFEAGSLVGLTDRQLLERFVAGEAAEVAFEALVERHGPMVRGVCRSMMGDLHEADDAFQATFLVLARRAGAIRRRDSVGSWLYGVACRVSARARADAARRRVLERYIAERSRLESSAPEPSREPMPEVLEELERMPERYRAPIVLCYLEGRSQEQAAQVLGCPLRTVQTRLQRGKAKLRTRLVRRGLAPAVMLALGLDAAEAAPVALGGALPSALSESTARASVQFAASRVAGLASIAVGLAQGVLRALFWQRLGRAAGLGFGLFLGIAAAIFVIAAAGQNADPPVTTIRGRVMDDAGRPIAGAEVWLPTSFDERPETTPHATADARGHYVLTVPEDWRRRPRHQQAGVVWAHAPGHRIDTANAYAALIGQSEAVDLVLGPATDTSFVVFGPDGRPVTGAVVEPYHVKTPINAYLFPPSALLPAIRAVTDANGRALLPAMGREVLRMVKVTTASLGSQILRLQDLATEPARREIRLRPAGRIEGRVIGGKPGWAGGLKVYETTTDSEDPQAPFQRTQGDDVTTTGPDGTFLIPAIATGKLVIATRVDESLPFRPLVPEGLDVPPGQMVRVEIPLERAVRVRGTIRETGTGQPIVGASVSIQYGWKDRKQRVKVGPAGSTTAVSDANGRFESYALPGDASMQVISMPDPFIQLGQPWAERHGVPEGVETFDLPSIEVVKGIMIEGRVVDGSDRPVTGIQVVGVADGRRYGFAKTRDQGEFTMGRVPPGIKLAYQVLVNDHDSPVDAENLKEEPLLLRAAVGTSDIPAASSGAGIHGTVVDTEGRPVDGVQVNLVIEARGTQRREPRTTDSQGVYRDPGPVVKGTKYRAIVSPGKFAIASSETVTAEGKDPITVPPISVVRLRTIAGRVVDTDGQPVAGARVLNWGNRAPLTDAMTGPAGRFYIDRLPRERAWLFVDAPGYRFHRATSDPGKSTTELTIRREGQPPERGVASLGRPITRERALELAAKVLKPYADKILKPESDPDARARVLEVLARIDPEGAWRKCQAGEKPWDGNAVRIAAARQFIASRLEDSEAILPTITNNFWRQTLRIELVDALPAEVRERKLALLGEAVLDARRSSQGSLRIHHLMAATARLIDLGRVDEARRVVDEALPLARTVDANEPRRGGTRAIIGCLSRLDLKAALALIPGQGDERTINDFRGLIAQSIAAAHPAESERLIGAMGWNKSETYAVKACRRMATVDLPCARRIAGQIEIEVLRGYALGTMAEAVGAVDLVTARQLRAESYRAFNQAMGGGMGGLWGARSAAAMAAALLPGVERTDPDRLAEAVDRVLSLRWYPRSVSDLTTTQPDTSGVEAMRGDAALAAVLVRYDHDLARSIARPIIDRLRTPLVDLESHYLDRYAVLPTLALADPEGAAELVEVIPDLKEEGIGQSRDIARLIAAGALAAPESQFWTIIRRSVSDLELVERED